MERRQGCSRVRISMRGKASLRHDRRSFVLTSHRYLTPRNYRIRCAASPVDRASTIHSLRAPKRLHSSWKPKVRKQTPERVITASWALASRRKGEGWSLG